MLIYTSLMQLFLLFPLSYHRVINNSSRRLRVSSALCRGIHFHILLLLLLLVPLLFLPPS